MTVTVAILCLVLLWLVCAMGTVWFAARYAGSDTALLNFVIWPIALLGTLCILANEKARIEVISELCERGLRARARARGRRT